MARYIIRRVALSVLTLFLLATIVFLIVNVFPGDVGRNVLGPFASQETVDALNEELGTDDPLLTQYGRLLKNVVTFDWGESFQYRVPVTELLWPALGRSAKLAALALVMTIPLAIAAGMFAARRRNTFADRSIVTRWPGQLVDPGLRVGRDPAVPLGCQARLVPGGRPRAQGLRHPHPARLPDAAGSRPRGRLLRLHRPDDARGTIQALDADYTRTAVMKGLSRRRVSRSHVMRNALQPTVSVIGVQIGYIFSSLIALELIFNYPGLGTLIREAAGAKDFPVLVAAVILVGIIYMLCTLAADLVIAWMNPRARLEVGRT